MDLIDLKNELDNLSDFDFLILCFVLSVRLEKIYSDKGVK